MQYLLFTLRFDTGSDDIGGPVVAADAVNYYYYYAAIANEISVATVAFTRRPIETVLQISHSQ